MFGREREVVAQVIHGVFIKARESENSGYETTS